MKILKKLLNETFLKILSVYILNISIIFVFYILLKSNIPLYLPPLILLLFTILRYLKQSLKGNGKKILNLAFIACVIFFAFLCLTGILITPYSSFRIWFDSFGNHPEGNTIANLFILLICFFTCLIGTILFNFSKWRYALLLISILLGLMVIIYPRIWLIIFFIFSLLIWLFFSLRMQFIANYFILVISLIFGLIIYLSSPQAKGSRLVDNILYPGLRNMVNNFLPEFPLLISIPGYGYSFRENELGGNNVLSPAKIFEIKAKKGEKLYITTKRYDTYTGRNWINKYFIIPDLQRNMKGYLFFPELGKKLIHLKLLTDLYNTIPFTVQTQQILFDSKRLILDDLEEFSRLNPRYPLKYEDKVTLWQYDDNRTPANRLSESEKEIFTRVPASLPERVRLLAENIGRNSVNQFALIYNIQEFLSTGFRYDLNAPALKKNEDFIDQFLFTDKKGYCTHYASTFVILARLNNIPARYVTGFLVYMPPDDDTSFITGNSLHAWPEIWSPEKGWEPKEATIALSFDYEDMEEEEEWLNYDSIAANRRTLEQLEEVLGRKIKKKNVFSIPVEMIIMVISGILILGICYLLFIMLQYRFKFLFFYDQQKKCIYSMHRFAARIRYDFNPDDKGWEFWIEQLKKEFPLLETKLEFVLIILQKLIYSQYSINKREINFLLKMRKRIQTQRIMNLFR